MMTRTLLFSIFFIPQIISAQYVSNKHAKWFRKHSVMMSSTSSYLNEYTYFDEQGRIRTIVDSLNGSVFTVKFDTLGRQISAWKIFFSRDSSGSITSDTSWSVLNMTYAPNDLLMSYCEMTIKSEFQKCYCYLVGDTVFNPCRMPNGNSTMFITVIKIDTVKNRYRETLLHYSTDDQHHWKFIQASVTYYRHDWKPMKKYDIGKDPHLSPAEIFGRIDSLCAKAYLKKYNRRGLSFLRRRIPCSPGDGRSIVNDREWTIIKKIYDKPIDDRKWLRNVRKQDKLLLYFRF